MADEFSPRQAASRILGEYTLTQKSGSEPDEDIERWALRSWFLSFVESEAPDTLRTLYQLGAADFAVVRQLECDRGVLDPETSSSWTVLSDLARHYETMRQYRLRQPSLPEQSGEAAVLALREGLRRWLTMWNLGEPKSSVAWLLDVALATLRTASVILQRYDLQLADVSTDATVFEIARLIRDDSRPAVRNRWRAALPTSVGTTTPAVVRNARRWLRRHPEGARLFEQIRNQPCRLSHAILVGAVLRFQRPSISYYRAALPMFRGVAWDFEFETVASFRARAAETKRDRETSRAFNRELRGFLTKTEAELTLRGFKPTAARQESTRGHRLDAVRWYVRRRVLGIPTAELWPAPSATGAQSQDSRERYVRREIRHVAGRLGLPFGATGRPSQAK